MNSKYWKSLLSALYIAVLGVVCLTPKTAHAAVAVSGTLKYNRTWSQVFSGSGSLVTSSVVTGLRPLKRVYVAVTCNAPAVCVPSQIETFADVNGNFTGSFTSVTGATTVTYRTRVIFRALNADNPAQFGYRLVQENAAGDQPASPEVGVSFLYDTVKTNTNAALGTKTLVAGTFENRRANAFEVLTFGVERWRALLFSDIDVLKPGLHFERAVAKIGAWTDHNPNSFCGVTNLTYPCFNFDTDQVDNDTGWHEMAHALMHALMTDYGSGGGWSFTGFSPACATPIPAEQFDNNTGSASISESWANFSNLNTVYPVASYPSDLRPFTGFLGGTFNPIDATNNNCNGCEYLPSGPQPVPPACGMSSIVRTENRGLKILIDLVDTVQTGPNCTTEDITLPVSHVLAAIVAHTSGTGQGQVGETLQTPRFGNSIRQEDASSPLDILRTVGQMESISASRIQKIWRNACWLPGDTDTGFVPGP